MQAGSLFVLAVAVTDVGAAVAGFRRPHHRSWPRQEQHHSAGGHKHKRAPRTHATVVIRQQYSTHGVCLRPPPDCPTHAHGTRGLPRPDARALSSGFRPPVLPQRSHPTPLGTAAPRAGSDRCIVKSKPGTGHVHGVHACCRPEAYGSGTCSRPVRSGPVRSVLFV